MAPSEISTSESNVRVANDLAGSVPGLADRTVQSDVSMFVELLKDDLPAGSIARLAQIVGRLRAGWVLGPGSMWKSIESIHEDSGSDLEQRVAFAIRALFFQFSHLLSEGHLLLVQFEEGRVSREELALQVEKFLGNVRDSGSRCCEISEFQCGLRHAKSRSNGADPSSN